MGGAQGCPLTSCNAQGSPHPQNNSAASVSRTEVRKLLHKSVSLGTLGISEFPPSTVFIYQLSLYQETWCLGSRSAHTEVSSVRLKWESPGPLQKLGL